VLYFQQLQAINGTPPYTWRIVSGHLPWGLMFTTAGAILGTAADDPVPPILVQVTDVLGATAVANVSIPVA
jgi:hypothetical protein